MLALFETLTLNETGVSLCKLGIDQQCGVGAGLVGTDGLFRVRLSPPFLSLLLRCGVGSRESQACALTSPRTFIKVNLHLRCQSQRYFSWIQTGAFLPAEAQSSPALFTTGLLKVRVKDTLGVGILKHRCRAKMGAAYLIRYHTLNCTSRCVQHCKQRGGCMRSMVFWGRNLNIHQMETEWKVDGLQTLTSGKYSGVFTGNVSAFVNWTLLAVRLNLFYTGVCVLVSSVRFDPCLQSKQCPKLSKWSPDEEARRSQAWCKGL